MITQKKIREAHPAAQETHLGVIRKKDRQRRCLELIRKYLLPFPVVFVFVY